MSLLQQLRIATSAAWTDAVLGDVDAFLLDHAACERKASATAMSLVSHYPDRHDLVIAMLDLAVEELCHFRQVYELLRERGLTLAADRRDDYVRGLRGLVRTNPRDYFLDRLLVGGIVEARGCERFGLVRDGLDAGPLRDFYRDIAASEARHQELFVDLARRYFTAAEVDARLAELLEAEAALVARLPHRPALH